MPASAPRAFAHVRVVCRCTSRESSRGAVANRGGSGVRSGSGAGRTCHRADRSAPPFGTSFLARDEEVVEATEKKVPLFRGAAVVAHLERLVVPNDADDVEDREHLRNAHEELKADG